MAGMLWEDTQKRFAEKIAKVSINPKYYSTLVVTPSLVCEISKRKNGVKRYKIRSKTGKWCMGFDKSFIRRTIGKLLKENDEVILNVGKTYYDVISKKDLKKLC